MSFDFSAVSMNDKDFLQSLVRYCTQCVVFCCCFFLFVCFLACSYADFLAAAASRGSSGLISWAKYGDWLEPGKVPSSLDPLTSHSCPVLHLHFLIAFCMNTLIFLRSGLAFFFFFFFAHACACHRHDLDWRHVIGIQLCADAAHRGADGQRAQRHFRHESIQRSLQPGAGQFSQTLVGSLPLRKKLLTV